MLDLMQASMDDPTALLVPPTCSYDEATGHITVAMDEKDAGTLLKLVDALEEDDDVQTVWGNYEVSDEVMEKLG